MTVKYEVYEITMNNGDIFKGWCPDGMIMRNGNYIVPIKIKGENGTYAYLNPQHISSYAVIGEKEFEVEEV